MKKLIVGLLLLLVAGATTLYYSPGALLASMQLVERQLAGLSHERLTVGDLSIHYYQGGPPDAPTILMLHGFGADKDNWLRFARHFTERYRVIAIDLPGFGDSSKPAASYDVGTQVERVAAFTQARPTAHRRQLHGRAYQRVICSALSRTGAIRGAVR